jgi:hypothetical protein
MKKIFLSVIFTIILLIGLKGGDSMAMTASVLEYYDKGADYITIRVSFGAETDHVEVRCDRKDDNLNVGIGNATLSDPYAYFIQLEPNTTYNIWAICYDAEGNFILAGNMLDITTLAGVIAGEPTITYNGQTSTSVTVRVTDMGTNALRTYVQLYRGSGRTISDLLQTSSPVYSNYTDVAFYGLDPGTEYHAEAYSVSSTGGASINVILDLILTTQQAITAEASCLAERSGTSIDDYQIYCSYSTLSPYTTVVEESHFDPSIGDWGSWFSYQGPRYEKNVTNGTRIKYRARYEYTGFSPGPWYESDYITVSIPTTPIPSSVTISTLDGYFEGYAPYLEGYTRHYQVRFTISGVWQAWRDCSTRDNGSTGIYDMTNVGTNEYVQFRCEYTLTNYQPGGWRESGTLQNVVITPEKPYDITVIPTTWYTKFTFKKGANAYATKLLVNGVTYTSYNTSDTFQIHRNSLPPYTVLTWKMWSVDSTNTDIPSTEVTGTFLSRPSNFTEFDSMRAGRAFVISENNIIVIPYSSWNNFTARINQFKDWKGYEQYSFTPAYENLRLTPDIYNEAVTAANDLGIYRYAVNSNTQIGISLFLGFSDALNSV